MTWKTRVYASKIVFFFYELLKNVLKYFQYFVANNIVNVKFSGALYYIWKIRKGDGVEPILVFRLYLRLFPLTGFH